MSDIIELYNLIKEHLPINLSISLLLILVSISSFIKIERLRHPRYKLRYLGFIILLLLSINIIILGWTNIFVTVLLLILITVYSLVAYLSSIKPILLSKWKIKTLTNLIEIGCSIANEYLFDKKPIYMLDFIEEYNFLMLKAKHLIALKRYKDAYGVYNSINERKLFDMEKTNLIRKKAFILYTMGDMNTANYYLNCISDDSDPNYLMLKSMIKENAMDIEGASQYLQKSLNLTNNEKDPVLRAMIYNNYGRLRFMEGNYTDAIAFYRQSKELARNQKSREIIHSTFQNLIHTSILKGEKDRGFEYFKEYEELIDNNNLNDMMEIFNLHVEIVRQNENTKEISKVIIKGYEEINPLLTKQQKIIFDTSVLRMLFNNNMNFDIVMNSIYENFENYFELEMPEKYFTLKEINIPLIQIQFPHCHKFALVSKRITDYMINDALEEIDSHVATLSNYEIHQRCQMEREKVGVLTNFKKPYRFPDIYKSMLDIKDIYQKNGMLIEAVFMDLDIADECYARENYLNNKIKSLPKRKMEKHLQLASESLSKLKNYPRVTELNIRLAIYYMALNETDKANKYFDDFEASEVPINHFSFWIRNGYEQLYKDFKV